MSDDDPKPAPETDAEDPPSGAPAEGAGALDENAESELKHLLKGALEAAPPPESDVLRGVQKRLRARSGGKFYADEWSTARRPTYTYLWTSVLMLVIVCFVYVMMATLGSVPHAVDNTPAPVRIVFPKPPQSQPGQ